MRWLGPSVKISTATEVIVDKSTVPVGTADRVRAIIAAASAGKHPFDVVSNPEFLKEGAAIDDFMKPDRVVIGADSDRARAVMSDLYAPFVRTNKPILHMDVRSAELTKYAANCMLATRISFMNEMARLCELLGANVDHVRKGIGTDSRIGFPFLFPGPGYGGSCFPKDVQALVQTASEVGYDLKIMQAVESVNAEQKHRLADKAKARFGGSLAGKVFCVWGLAFKPNTDDMREAPALVVVEDLVAAGATVHVTDPEAMDNTRRLLGDRVTYFSKNYDAAKGADALILVTEWNEYRPARLRDPEGAACGPRSSSMVAIFTTGRRSEAAGFEYHGIGL
jgi:UDPglucose 6-dehydrogenase